MRIREDMIRLESAISHKISINLAGSATWTAPSRPRCPPDCAPERTSIMGSTRRADASQARASSRLRSGLHSASEQHSVRYQQGHQVLRASRISRGFQDFYGRLRRKARDRCPTDRGSVRGWRRRQSRNSSPGCSTQREYRRRKGLSMRRKSTHLIDRLAAEVTLVQACKSSRPRAFRAWKPATFIYNQTNGKKQLWRRGETARRHRGLRLLPSRAPCPAGCRERRAPALLHPDSAGESAAQRRRQARFRARCRGRGARRRRRRQRDQLHAGARAAAGFHRRALRGGPRRHARRPGRHGRRSRAAPIRCCPPTW